MEPKLTPLIPEAGNNYSEAGLKAFEAALELRQQDRDYYEEYTLTQEEST